MDFLTLYNATNKAAKKIFPAVRPTVFPTEPVLFVKVRRAGRSGEKPKRDAESLRDVFEPDLKSFHLVH
jgi:hypothetical protein